MTSRLPSAARPTRPRGEIAILIVEDEKIVAHDLARLIGDMGYWVMGTAKSSDEALALAGQNRPDLVLMDVHLKGELDGVATARKLRERWDTPVVYLTAFADDDTLARARDTGPFGYLVKPVKDHDLKAAVEMALFKHSVDSTLRERERWFATTLRSVGDAVLTVDPGLRVTFLNPEAERLTGLAQADALGKPVDDVLCLVDERSRQPAEGPLARVFASGRAESPSGFLVICASRNAEYPIESSAAPIVDDEEQVLGAVLVFRDVTRKRRLEEQFIVADRLVALGTLAGGVAHEINNPLTLITNNAHFAVLELGEIKRALAQGTLKPGAGSDARFDELLAAMKDVNEGARRAAAIIEDMRRFSAHEPSAREPVDLRATVEWAARMSMAQILPRARLETDLVDLPMILANRTRIAQVFINILVNAGQAIPEGEPRERHRVSVVARPQADSVFIAISDTGIGMTREVRQRVFEPFFTTKAVGGGSGLGMAVAHGIVAALGGRIEIESVEQRGTTVRVILPVVPLG